MNGKTTHNKLAMVGQHLTQTNISCEPSGVAGDQGNQVGNMADRDPTIQWVEASLSQFCIPCMVPAVCATQLGGKTRSPATVVQSL